jgi:hypothetical protein
MILPNKYITLEDSLLGLGYKLLEYINEPISVSDLWSLVKQEKDIISYNRFISALDMLYIMGLIDLNNNQIEKQKG